MMISRSYNLVDEQSQVEDAYIRFIRLVADIDQIVNEIAAVKSFILAHDDMRQTIQTFRKDVRKLLTPNEVEVSFLIEKVYDLMDDEKRTVVWDKIRTQI